MATRPPARIVNVTINRRDDGEADISYTPEEDPRILDPDLPEVQPEPRTPVEVRFDSAVNNTPDGAAIGLMLGGFREIAGFPSFAERHRGAFRSPSQELVQQLREQEFVLPDGHRRAPALQQLSIATPESRRAVDDLRDALRYSIAGGPLSHAEFDCITSPYPRIEDYEEDTTPKAIATRTIGRTVDGIEYDQVVYDDGSRKRKIVGGTAPITVPRSKWRAR